MLFLEAMASLPVSVGAYVRAWLAHWARRVTSTWYIVVLEALVALLAMNASVAAKADGARYAATAANLQTAQVWLPVSWLVIAAIFASYDAWKFEREQHNQSVADLEAERDTRPKLSATILAAFCHSGSEPDTWVTQTTVDIRNAGQKAVRLDGWETILQISGTEFPGRPNESLLGTVVNIDQEPVPQIKALEQIGGLDLARGTIASTVYSIPAGTCWHDCIVKVRVRGVGCDWSEWTTFRPPGTG